MADGYDSFDDFEPETQYPAKEARDNQPESIVDESQRPDPMHDTMVENFENEADGPVQDSEEEDIIKILVATDIHCGYGERKPIIDMDAVNTFEEVLQIATEQKVDMILLGGDLFHENNPSREVTHRVTQLLRKYCLNGNPISLEFLSDASVNFNQSVFDHVNYYDENINVGLPIFTIHGNHDDLSGKGLTALDILHEAGLINLFGKHENIKDFQISPILLKKGETRLALYGMGSQRDDRIVRAFKEEAIQFHRPSIGPEDWFNLFVLHQNRPRRSTTRSTGNYFPESLVPSFFDLLIWGHEHECKPAPQYSTSSEAVGDGFYILQPGSTVATSLTPEEALQKNVFLLKIRNRKFKTKPIPLQTVRPMVCDELVLNKLPAGFKSSSKTIRPQNKEGNYYDEIAIEEKLREMIDKANKNRGPRQPKLPLIRLKVIYYGDWAKFTPANTKRIGLRYEGIVANSLDMVTIKKITEKNSGAKLNIRTMDEDQLSSISSANLQIIINDHFAKLPLNQRMTVFKPTEIGKALEQYAEIEDCSVASANKNFDEAMARQVEFVSNLMKEMPLPKLENFEDIAKFRDAIKDDLMNMKKAYYEKVRGDVVEVEEDEDELFYAAAAKTSYVAQRGADSSDEASSDTTIQSVTKSRRGRGRGRGRAATTATRGARSSRVSPADDDIVCIDSDDEVESVPAKSTRGRGRGRGTRGKRKMDDSFL